MAVLVPLPVEAVQVERLHGFLRGSVIIPREIDLTAPIADEAFAADEDVIHQWVGALRQLRCCSTLCIDLACQL